MNRILNGIFKYKKPNYDKLLKYGFTLDGEKYVYVTELNDCGMSLEVIVADGEVDTVVTDLATDEPFTLFLVEEASGAFVGSVRAEYEKVLGNICANCFEKRIFKSDITEQVISFVREQFGCELEFLWADTPDTAIWRRADNRKWFGAVMIVQKRKIGVNEDGSVEIIDLRAHPDEVESLVNREGYSRGYHMNKKHWITITLDGCVPAEEVFDRILISYDLAKKK